MMVMLTSKLCTACGEEDRVLLPNGKLGPMCAGCQKDADDNARAAKAAETRFCKTCKTNKPRDQFLKTSRVCNDCRTEYSILSLKPDATRHCQGCQETKPLSAFRRMGNYYQALCQTCYDVRKAEAKRRKAEGLPPLPRMQVKGSAPLDDLYPAGSIPTNTPLVPGVVLIDRDRGQVTLCTVVSEATLGVRNLDSLKDFYQQRGHRIMEVSECEIACAPKHDHAL